jgi:hypothetical protein
MTALAGTCAAVREVFGGCSVPDELKPDFSLDRRDHLKAIFTRTSDAGFSCPS